MESKEGFFGEDSLIASFQSNYENPILTSIERNYDPQNVIVEKTIYKEPKYIKDKNVYEEKEPIINNLIYLPEAKNNKERTAKPIIKAEKEFQDDYEMENYLNGDNFEDSIPTKSTILNIMQSKVFSPSTFQQSKAFSKYSNSHSSSKVNYNIINNNIYNTKSEIQKSNKINMLNNTECNLKKQSNYSYKSTKLNNNNSNYFNNKSMNIINNINKNTSINNKINNNIINSNINNNISNNIFKKDYSEINKSKNTFKKEEEGTNEEVTQIINNNLFFNDSKIPNPSVHEGNALNYSNSKLNNSNSIQKSSQSNINNKTNNILDIKNEKNEFEGNTQIINNNLFFNDSKIPNPSVHEGNALNYSNSKLNNSNSIQKSLQTNITNKAKNILEQLPVEHTIILSKKPKIDMSKVQKMNMSNKSNSEHSNNSYADNNNNIKNNSINNNNINISNNNNIGNNNNNISNIYSEINNSKKQYKSMINKQYVYNESLKTKKNPLYQDNKSQTTKYNDNFSNINFNKSYTKKNSNIKSNNKEYDNVSQKILKIPSNIDKSEEHPIPEFNNNNHGTNISNPYRENTEKITPIMKISNDRPY